LLGRVGGCDLTHGRNGGGGFLGSAFGLYGSVDDCALLIANKCAKGLGKVVLEPKYSYRKYSYVLHNPYQQTYLPVCTHISIQPCNNKTQKVSTSGYVKACLSIIRGVVRYRMHCHWECVIMARMQPKCNKQQRVVYGGLSCVHMCVHHTLLCKCKKCVDYLSISIDLHLSLSPCLSFSLSLSLSLSPSLSPSLSSTLSFSFFSLHISLWWFSKECGGFPSKNSTMYDAVAIDTSLNGKRRLVF